MRRERAIERDTRQDSLIGDTREPTTGLEGYGLKVRTVPVRKSVGLLIYIAAVIAFSAEDSAGPQYAAPDGSTFTWPSGRYGRLGNPL